MVRLTSYRLHVLSLLILAATVVGTAVAIAVTYTIVVSWW